MADTVDVRVMFSSKRHYHVRLVNHSDGTGESAVVKIDKSTLTGPDGTEPGRIVIEEVTYSVNGFEGVKLLWDHNTDDEALMLSGSGYYDFRPSAGLIDPASTGGTGDLLLTTVSTGAGAAGDSYDIYLICRLKD